MKSDRTKKPTLHLICNAHLDPVWQWRWEEGCGEAMSTFGTAIRMLESHPALIFNHNEAVLYRWVQKYDPALFRAIQRMVKKGRWCISGGWYLQPDVNMPGIESTIRQIAEGRRFFRKYFDAVPRVAYNFDSFGHGGGLPQVLVQAGYKMYIHMRPQEPEMHLPSDLYRWRGVDGSTIAALRIAVGLYHTERDNIEERLAAGTDLAVKLGRDVPVFWGIGNHGGGATSEDLDRIDAFMRREKRVRIIHSTPDRLYEALKKPAASAPIVEGDLQRVFTGCYTSLSRLKRREQRSLGELVQIEAMRSLSWWKRRLAYPSDELRDLWRDHLFNDFHDILPGSCTEPAEQDALDLYGRVAAGVRQLRMAVARSLNGAKPRQLYVPATVLNANPSVTQSPVELECMLDLRPKWSGKWHLRLFDLQGNEIPSQEEQPESLLPFNGWRRKVVAMAALPQIGGARFEIRIVEGERSQPAPAPAVPHTIDAKQGLVTSLLHDTRQMLDGALFRPLVVEDEGDAWGADCYKYRNVVGIFQAQPEAFRVLHTGPIRTVTESFFKFGESSIRLHTIWYAQWPLLEFRFRIQWNEIRRRLKLSVPTKFRADSLLCEIPGGTIRRPADGEEHVHGRWFIIGDGEAGLGVVSCGQHGLDCLDGEVRLSVLRSAAYCHEKGFAIGPSPVRKYMDQGVHEIRLLVLPGRPAELARILTGYADWLAAPPAVYTHLPIGAKPDDSSLLSLDNPAIRLVACKQSDEDNALIVRLQECGGAKESCSLCVDPKTWARLTFRPHELKTIRVERNGKWKEVGSIEEE